MSPVLLFLCRIRRSTIIKHYSDSNYYKHFIIFIKMFLFSYQAFSNRKLSTFWQTYCFLHQLHAKGYIKYLSSQSNVRFFFFLQSLCLCIIKCISVTVYHQKRFQILHKIFWCIYMIQIFFSFSYFLFYMICFCLLDVQK